MVESRVITSVKKTLGKNHLELKTMLIYKI
jgi:hypothetical protein